ncbi:hypothetical protein D5086_025152, partial [Populus alba]
MEVELANDRKESITSKVDMIERNRGVGKQKGEDLEVSLGKLKGGLGEDAKGKEGGPRFKDLGGLSGILEEVGNGGVFAIVSSKCAAETWGMEFHKGSFLTWVLKEICCFGVLNVPCFLSLAGCHSICYHVAIMTLRSLSTPGFVGADLNALVNTADGKLPSQMADFEKAAKLVQPSSKREGFSTIPNVKWEDVGGLDDIRDEFDLYIISRIKYPDDYQLLIELDGADQRPGIFIIGATNSSEDRGLILKALAKGKPIDPSVDLAAIGQMEACKNFSGADLRKLAKRQRRSNETSGTIMAAQNEPAVNITATHFEQALGKISPSVSEKGLEQLRTLRSPSLRVTEMQVNVAHYLKLP